MRARLTSDCVRFSFSCWLLVFISDPQTSNNISEITYCWKMAVKIEKSKTTYLQTAKGKVLWVLSLRDSQSPCLLFKISRRRNRSFHWEQFIKPDRDHERRNVIKKEKFSICWIKLITLKSHAVYIFWSEVCEFTFPQFDNKE